MDRKEEFFSVYWVAMIVNKKEEREREKEGRSLHFFRFRDFVFLLFLSLSWSTFFSDRTRPYCSVWAVSFHSSFVPRLVPTSSNRHVKYTHGERTDSPYLSISLSRSISCMDFSSHFPGNEKIAKRSRKKTSFSTNSRIRPSIVCQAQSMDNNSSVSFHWSMLLFSSLLRISFSSKLRCKCSTRLVFLFSMSNYFCVQNCTVYVLDHTGQIQIDDCTNCRIFIGPVHGR
jgi:hypothetical protein